jgi:hypothetical protein
MSNKRRDAWRASIAQKATLSRKRLQSSPPIDPRAPPRVAVTAASILTPPKQIEGRRGS